MLFNDLSERDIKVLEKKGTLRHYDNGAFIIREGTSGSTFGIILKGKAEVRKNLSDKHSKAVAELKPCDMIGEMGFFGITKRSADVVALTICEILEFDRESFDKFTLLHPIIGMKIYRNMATILANRLVNTNIEQKDSIGWSISREIDRTRHPDIRQNYSKKLKIRNEPDQSM